MIAPITCVKFLRGVCKLPMTKPQEILVRVCFDRRNPCDYEGEDREIARRLFGDADTVSDSARGVIAWVVGARSGKSRMAACVGLWFACFADLAGLAPGEQASCLFLAPDVRLGRQTLRYAAGVIHGNKDLAKRVQNETKDSIELLRDDRRTVTLEVLPATTGGRATRGRALVFASLDECAFFRSSDDHSVNDTDIFNSVSPRIVAGGALLLCSTPWAKAGLLFEEYSKNFGQPTTSLVAHAPTALMRAGDQRIKAMIDRERLRDEENYRREYAAEFLEIGAGGLFSQEAIEDATRLGADIERHRRTPMAAGGDFAFFKDASAVVISSVTDDGLVFIEHVDEMRPSKDAPLIPSVVCRNFARACQQFGIGSLIADAHNKASIIEHLSENGIEYQDAPITQKAIAESYLVVRELLQQGRLGLPSHKRLLKQMREATLVVSPGGGLSVRHPRTAGSHGDLVSALVLAVAQAATGPTGEAAIGGSRRYKRKESDTSWNSEGGSSSGACDWAEDYCDEGDED